MRKLIITSLVVLSSIYGSNLNALEEINEKGYPIPSEKGMRLIKEEFSKYVGDYFDTYTYVKEDSSGFRVHVVNDLPWFYEIFPKKLDDYDFLNDKSELYILEDRNCDGVFEKKDTLQAAMNTRDLPDCFKLKN